MYAEVMTKIKCTTFSEHGVYTDHIGCCPPGKHFEYKMVQMVQTVVLPLFACIVTKIGILYFLSVNVKKLSLLYRVTVDM